MQISEWVTIQCPYCGEPIDVTVNRTELDQTVIEDCQVCCQPMVLSFAVDGSNELMATAEREGA